MNGVEAWHGAITGIARRRSLLTTPTEPKCHGNGGFRPCPAQYHTADMNNGTQKLCEVTESLHVEGVACIDALCGRKQTREKRQVQHVCRIGTTEYKQ